MPHIAIFLKCVRQGSHLSWIFLKCVLWPMYWCSHLSCIFPKVFYKTAKIKTVPVMWKKWWDKVILSLTEFIYHHITTGKYLTLHTCRLRFYMYGHGCGKNHYTRRKTTYSHLNIKLTSGELHSIYLQNPCIYCYRVLPSVKIKQHHASKPNLCCSYDTA